MSTEIEVGTNETIPLIGWGTFEDLQNGILHHLFGEMVKRATPVVQQYHGDLFVDVEWMRANVTGPSVFEFVVRPSGTYIGDAARICRTSDALWERGGIAYSVAVYPDDRDMWHADFVTLRSDVAAVTNRERRTTAQVAVEAIINDPQGYDPDTMRQVYDFAAVAGVSDFYLDQLEALA